MRKVIFSQLFIISIFLLTSQTAFSQVSVTGSVKESGSTAVSGANVLLLNKADSLLVKGTVTNAAGNFSFENIKQGLYIIQTSFVGYKQSFSSAISVEKTNVDAGTIQLLKDEVTHTDVTVVVKKPMFEQKIDRMIVNVRNSITSAGGTALEVLEKSPGVVINRQSNSIGMNGKNGVVVMINGKISRMTQDALLQMLAGMNASNIDHIELITTPPANFDAEGNAGFIDIVLYENPNKGFNGSYSLSAGYGKGMVGAASMNFNYRNKKINFFGDYSLTQRNQEQIFEFYRRYMQQSITVENSSKTLRDPEDGNNTARLGLDIQVTPKTVIGFLTGGYISNWEMTAQNHLSITKNHIVDSNVSIVNTEVNRWKHFMGNINVSHTINSKQTITADLDYLYYTDNNPNDYNNRYFNGNGTELGTEQTRSTKHTPLNFWVGKLDYSNKLSKKVSAEAGAKLSLSEFSNDVAVEKGGPANWVKDPALTAKYKLKEDIAAAYVAFSIQATEKASFKLGLRYEHTTSNLGSDKQQNIVDRKYGRFFPSVFYTQKLDDNNSFTLSYSRRITRPTFKDMAPFVIFIDPYTFFSGNSGLQPAFSDVYKTDYVYKKLVFSVSYTNENESIANFQPKISADNKQIYASENLDNTKTVNFSTTLPFTIAKWWSMQNNLQATWQRISAFFNKGPFTIEQKFFGFNSSQNFTLPKEYSMELSAFYQSKSLFGASVFEGVGMINFGVQKKFGKNNNKLRFNINNVLAGGIFKGTTDIPAENLYVYNSFRFSQRTFQFTYSQNFGNKKLNDKRSRSTASDEEQRRMN